MAHTARLEPGDRRRDPPLSFAQERLWFLDQMGAGPLCNIALSLRLRGPLNEESLDLALQEIVRRHQTLRTCFPTVGGQPVQRIAESLTIPLIRRDLRTLEAAAREAEALRLAQEAADHPFDLGTGPPLRAELIRLDEEDRALLLTMHHIVWDHWSTGILFSELTPLYEAFAQGRQPQLPELPEQYADFAAWQRGWLRGEAREGLLSYWRQQLEGLVPLDLPTDRPRPAEQRYRSAVHDVAISRELSGALQDLASRQRMSLAMVLLAAWQVLLARYSGQEEVAVGVPVANRSRAELGALIGVFVNTLVVRTDLSGDPSFLDGLLPRVKEAALAAYEHQDLPFEKLVAELDPDRDPSRHPLFQVMFSLVPRRRERLQLGDVAIQPLGLARGAPELTRKETIRTPVDLELRVAEHPGGLTGRLIYDTDLFVSPTIERMGAHFKRLLEAIVADPRRRVSELPLLGEGERRRLVLEWNDTKTGDHGDRCLHELFAEQVRRTPQATALVTERRRLSFEELEAHAVRLARLLADGGIGRGDRVGLCLERSPEAIVGMLGVLKAGGAYVPLDPAHPRERLAFLIADVRAPAVLTRAGLLESIPAFGGKILCLDVDGPPARRGCDGPARRRATADDPAYVMYTSGSTGLPKGVVGLHRGATNRILWEASAAPWQPGEVACQKTDLGFVDSVNEIFGPLCAGVTLALVPDEVVKDPVAFVEQLAEREVTRIVLVPSLLATILDAVDELGRRLPRLTRWTASGEPLPRKLAERLLAQVPHATLQNIYGSTEVAADATMFEVSAAWRADGSGRDVPIGRPLANVRTFVLDRSMRPLPVGLPGELYVGGAGLAQGYWNRPALTAAAFIPDPLGADPGARLYRTGDVARFREGGVLECRGRLDHQVKLRGIRIELGEVGAVLEMHPAVAEAVAVVRKVGPGDERLVAYVVPRTGPVSAAELLAFARQRLPASMLPVIVVVDRLPRTTSGKVDRKALPEPDPRGQAAVFVEPRSGTEEVLCAIWKDVLNVDPVGVHDDFFDLGGHSLLATRVVARIRRILDLEVPTREMFVHRTVAALSEHLRAEGTRPQAPPLAPRNRPSELPLSFSQERMWFFDQLGTGLAINIPLALRLRGLLNIAALEAALTEILARHEALRTSFHLVAGRPVQRVAPGQELSIGRVDLSALDADAREVRMIDVAQQEAGEPFDLSAPPLLRAVLLDLGCGEHVLLLTMPHAASDGWSTGVLLAELACLYEAFAAGRDSPLADLPVQYADFTLWQREWLQGAVLDSQIAYWRRQLDGLPPLDLPTDLPRPAEATYRSALHDFTMSRELSAALAALARREGSTLAMVLVAVWQVLLGRMSGQQDVAVGLPIANRTRVELEPLIGFFVNTLVLRTDLSGDPHFASGLLPRVRKASLAAYEHQDLPFEKLVQALDPQREPSRHPLFQALFIFQNAPREPLRLEGLEIEELLLPTGSSGLDLDLRVSQRGDRLGGRLLYNPDLFAGSTIERLAKRWVRLLEGIAANPGARLSGLPLLGEEERRRLFLGWSEPATDIVGERCAFRLFEECARRAPARNAVELEGVGLTYAELDRRANRLAHRLIELGLVHEDRVGVAVERSVDMVVCLLAVHKAGGAYLPLDPDYPAERLAFMIADAAPRVVLTQTVLAGSIPVGPALAVSIDDDAAFPEVLEESPGREVRPDQLAYVIYTSGSTGTPKGVLIEHRSLASFLLSAGSVLGLASDDVLLALTSLSFDIAGLELFLPLVNGARLVIARRSTVRDPRALMAELERVGATVCQATPTGWQALTQAGWRGDGCLKMLSGGEVLPRPLADDLLARGGELWNLYGPTETTIYSALERVAPGDGPVAIGRPIGNTQLLVLDAALQAVPPGAAGELFIGGGGLARGYLNRPAETAERFVPSPWPDEVPGRLYRTGDRVRIDAGGKLLYLGRFDDQLKLRGYRVEPGEIEAALAEHPAVKRAVVVVRDKSEGDRRLLACLVLEHGQRPDPAALRAFLRQRVPEHMLPGGFAFLDALPASPTGKVDRRALAAAAPVAGDEARLSVAPRSPTEEVVASLFREILGVVQVGAHDDFFALGGHSLLAIRLVSRIRDAFRVELALRQVFASPTVAGLAVEVDQERRAEGYVSPGEIRAVGRDAPLPLSFAQQRLWVLDQMGTGSAYNLRLVLGLTGTLDRAALEGAVQALGARHEVLRTRFVPAGGTPFQVVEEEAPVPVRFVDLRQLDPEERQRALGELAVRAVEDPFDLERAPLIRATVVRSGEEEHALILVLHHIVADGWSVRILAREIAAYYRSRVTGEATLPPRLPVQFADFAVWQRERVSGAALDGTLAYWRRQLGGQLPILDLPTDRPRPPVQTFRGALHRFTVEPALAFGLRAVSRERRVTLATVFLAAFQTLLARYTGQPDVVVGSPIAGRPRSEVEDLVGCFANSVVLRTDLSGNPTFGELLDRVQEVFLAAYDHQELPFEHLIHEIHPTRDPSRTPLFQVVFAMQQVEQIEVEAAGLTLRGKPVEVTTARYDLELYIVDRPDGLAGQLVYNADLFVAPTIARLAGHFLILLAGAVERPDARLSQLPLLSDAELHHVLVDFNDTGVASAPDEALSVHHQFEARAAATPEALAVVHRGGALTYRELNARANQLANFLASRGVGREALVGLCVERGPEMLIGMLAILKAGGAFLPLEPSSPRERLAFLLADAAVAILLTQESMAGGLPVHEAEAVRLDTDWPAIGAFPASDPGVPGTADDLAYAIYTSGSTGRPKAALLEHRGLTNVAREQRRAFAVGAGSRVLQFASPAFDASIFEAIMALTMGATLFLGEAAELAPGPELLAFLRLHAIEVVTLPPSVLAAVPFADLPSLSTIAVAGEACPPALVARWAPGRRFFNLYGPTEATIWSTTARMEAGDDVLIGRPIGNTRVYLLDRHLNPVPVGVPAEIHIGGTGVGRGYHRRPGLTADRFVPSPFQPGERLYRSGDRARHCPDGSIEFLGRLDQQVKLHGHRIELGEIEAALARHPLVAEAAADLLDQDGREPALVAWFVPSGESRLEPQELRDFVGMALPAYLVPARLARLDRLPRTASGKVDRKALREVRFASGDGGPLEAPERAVEKALAAIWADALGVDRVSRHDNFFDLGGHSFLALAVLARIEREVGPKLKPRDLLFGTLCQLAARCEELQPEQRGRSPRLFRLLRRLRVRRAAS